MKPLFKIVLVVVVSCFFSTHVQSQDKKISLTGYIKDSDNAVIKDAVLFLDDVKTKITPNNRGVYKIKISPDVKKIRLFSYSRGVKDVEYNGQKRIDFIFQNNVAVANKVKVKTKRKETFQYKDIYDMIRDRVPGVRVNSDNSILIRGTSTINSSTQPLFIVNNAPVITLDNIVPASVKSIRVLKGPETAIYGVRGTNGVILITLIKRH